jgi:hypothetical protein
VTMSSAMHAEGRVQSVQIVKMVFIRDLATMVS